MVQQHRLCMEYIIHWRGKSRKRNEGEREMIAMSSRIQCLDNYCCYPIRSYRLYLISIWQLTNALKFKFDFWLFIFVERSQTPHCCLKIRTETFGIATTFLKSQRGLRKSKATKQFHTFDVVRYVLWIPRKMLFNLITAMNHFSRNCIVVILNWNDFASEKPIE